MDLIVWFLERVGNSRCEDSHRGQTVSPCGVDGQDPRPKKRYEDDSGTVGKPTETSSGTAPTTTFQVAGVLIPSTSDSRQKLSGERLQCDSALLHRWFRRRRQPPPPLSFQPINRATSTTGAIKRSLSGSDAVRPVLSTEPWLGAL